MGDAREFIHLVTGKWAEEADAPRIETLKGYLDMLIPRRTRGGVFAVKLFYEHLQALTRNNIELKEPHYLFLRRRNKTAQLVSYLTLLQTRAPYDSDVVIEQLPMSDAVTDKHILTYAKYLAHSEHRWQRFLRGKPHIEIYMEDFYTAPEVTLRAVSDMLGVDPKEQMAEALDYLAESSAYSAHRDVKDQIRRDHADVLGQVSALYDG